MAIHPLILQQFSFIKQLPKEVIEELASYAIIKNVAKREIIITKDVTPQYLCFLVQGKLQAIDFTLEGREVGLYSIEPGDYFAELSMIDGLKPTEFIIALENSQILLIPGAQMRRLIYQTPALSEQLSQRLAQRIRNQISQQKILALNNPVQRIMAQLTLLSPSNAQPVIQIKAPTHQEIAIMVNLTRETVTRTFQVLQSQGIIRREGDQILIDQDKLKVFNQQNIKAKG